MIFDTASVAEMAGALVAVAGACGLIVRAVTRDAMHKLDALASKHDHFETVVGDKIDDVKHGLKNQAMRIDAVEHMRIGDVERIVKLESAVQAIDKAVERVERGQDKLASMMTDRFDTLAEALRKA